MTVPVESPAVAAATVARELLRAALLAKLAVDLQDPRLARRAARQAQTQAGLLSGLDFPQHTDEDDDLGDRADRHDLPELEHVLALRYPTSPAQPEGEPA